MNKFAWVAMGLLVAAVAIGCNEGAKGGGGTSGEIVAAVDLQQVAEKTGQDPKYREMLEKYANKLNDAVKAKVEPMQKELAALAKAFDEEAAKQKKLPEAEQTTDANKAKLQALYTPWYTKRQDIEKEVTDARAKIQKYDAKMKGDFAKALQPALKAVCEKKGVRVLVGASVYAAPEAELTADLIDYLKAHPLPEPAAPAED